MDAVTIILCIIGIIATYKIFDCIRKINIETYRNVVQAYNLVLCFYCLSVGLYGYAVFMGVVMLLFYAITRINDKYFPLFYLQYQAELDRLIKSGYTNTQQANDLRTKMGRIWRCLPETQKAKILEYEQNNP